MSFEVKVDSEATMPGGADPIAEASDPLRQLFDVAPVPMWIYDRQSLRFLAVNDAAARTYGYSRKEFLKLTVYDIRPPEEAPKVRLRLETYYQENPRRADVWTHQSKCGYRFEVETTTTAIRFQGCDAEMVVAHDVSAHMREQRGTSIRYAINRLLSESSDDVTDKALRALCEWMDFDLAEYWQPYAGNHVLLRKTYWQPADDEPIRPAAPPVLLESSEGMLVQTWLSGWPGWIDGFAGEPGYQDRVAELENTGISEGIAFAVRARGVTLGIIVLLSRGRHERAPQTVELMRDIGAQIGTHLERCRVEAESRKSAESFRALFEDAPVAYHEIDRKGLVVRVNRPECELLGLQPADMIGKPVWDFVAPEEREESRESVRMKFAEGRVRAPYERIYCAADGAPRVFLVHERLIVQPGGEVTGIRTAMLDLTAQRESQRKIEFQAGLLDQVGDAIVTLDRGLNVTYCNGAAERMFGVLSEEAIGKDYRTAVPLELGPDEMESLFAALDSQGYWRGEFAITNRRGERLVLEANDFPLCGPNGEKQGVVAILRDITQCRLAEDALRATENRMTLAQSVINIGSWEVDLKAPERARCSSQMLRLLGLPDSNEGITQQQWEACIHPEDRDRVLAEVAANVAGPGALDRQYRVVWPDGTVHWLHSKTRLVLDSFNRPDKLIGVDFDITEHQAADERLRILSSAVEQSPVSIVITNLHGIIEYANRKTTEITGYTLDELRGQHTRILKSGHTSTEEYRNLWATIPTGEWHGVFHNKKKNGEFFWEDARISPILDASGNASHYLAVKEDITEQRAMEAALKASEERFRIAAENSGDVIYEWDIASGAVRSYGKKHNGRLRLVTPEAHIKRIHPQDRERVRNAVQRELDEGGPYSEEYRIVSRPGQVRYLSDRASVVRDAGGKPYRWIGVLKDVTELQAAQRANAELAAIVESAETAIVSQDLSGQLLTWNAGAQRIYGYSAEEMIGRNMIEIVPPERRAEEEAIFRKCRLGERVDNLETMRVTKSGELIHVLVTVSPMRDQSGAVIGAARVSWNITELKLLQRQLSQAQKLESIGQLAAGIAHEINTPIQYIGDNAKFLDEAFRDLFQFIEPHRELASRLRDSGDADAIAAVERAVENVDVEYLRAEIPKAVQQLLEGVANVAKIVRAMKEFSHPGPVDKAPVDLNRAIESTIVVSRNEWKYVAELSTDFDPGLPPVPCLASEFNQVILNLIVNAAHAIADVVGNSNGKGAISISTRRDGGWVEVRVRDSGAGIPDEIRGKIFTPFFTTKEVGKGTGQGLAISHSVIVKKHQGTIAFESTPGVGTTFIVRLPLECGKDPV